MFREASGEDATKKKPVDSEKDALKSRKQMEDSRQVLITVFTITTEIHARSLANFYCQYPDRHIKLKFMRN